MGQLEPLSPSKIPSKPVFEYADAEYEYALARRKLMRSSSEKQHGASSTKNRTSDHGGGGGSLRLPISLDGPHTPTAQAIKGALFGRHEPMPAIRKQTTMSKALARDKLATAGGGFTKGPSLPGSFKRKGGGGLQFSEPPAATLPHSKTVQDETCKRETLVESTDGRLALIQSVGAAELWNDETTDGGGQFESRPTELQQESAVAADHEAPRQLD